MKFSARNISVNRGARPIVRDVSFILTNGDALVVTGENGSGKSTLLRALAGLLPLAAGSLGFNLLKEEADNPLRIREHVHYLGHLNAMKPALSVRENLTFWQDFSLSGEESGEVVGLPIAEALEIVELPHVIDLPFGYLSTGMKRRVAIARLLIHEKPVWIVDEPTAGLDARSSRMFTELCQGHCKNGGILIAATHLPLGIDNAKSLVVKPLSAREADDPFADQAGASA